VKTLLALLLLVGCGTYEVPQAETSTNTASSTATATATEADSPREVADSPPPSDVKVEVETKVTVTIENGEVSPIAKWHYVEKRKIFADAEKDAPEGYRLPTRLELLTDFSSGLFADYTGSVWTSEHAEDRFDHVFFFKLSDGQSFAYPVESLFGTLYVTKANDEKSDSAQEDRR
jgi:hypothetical protein